MSTASERFRSHDYPVPDSMLAWQIHGAGFENLGIDGAPERIPVPTPGPMEILCRVDALGLCFSDVKLIRAGNRHPRILGWDLAATPTRPGHEVSLTLAAIGDEVDFGWEIGDRFVIQANIRWKGEDVSFGYVIAGGLSEYVLLDERVLAGDHGNYLLPITDDVGLVEAALVEPWSCVEGAYRLPQRTSPLEGGRRLVVALDGGDVPPDVTAGAGAVETVASGEAGDLARAAEALGGAPDDIFIIGEPTGELCGEALDVIADGGTLCLLGCSGVHGTTMVDVGRVHYRDVRVVGSPKLDVSSAYGSNTRKDVLPGGSALFAGSAGPMGMMHVQRAIEAADPPRLVVVTDISAERLGYAERLLGPVAGERGVEYTSVNPGELSSPEECHELLDALSGGRGYDDVVICAPVGAVISDAAKHVALGCVINIFAGIPLGTMSELDLGDAAARSVKYTGASGSAIEDMDLVLEKIAAGNLNTRMSLGAAGGMNQGLEGLQGVGDGTFLGKVVIFPWVEDLSLATAAELDVPGLAGALAPGGIWTDEAERLFVERFAPEAPGLAG